ncbi:MAG: hypothetical protein VW268_01070 [Rhodospirillaceae bacterium]
MTGFRSNRPAIAALGAVLAIWTAGQAPAQAPQPAALAKPATAQPAADAPAALAPPTMLKPQRPLQTETPKPEAPAALPPGTGAVGPAVQVDALGQVDLETVGTLGPGNGGLGQNLWQGAGWGFVDRMFDRVPVKTPSPVMRGLMRRILLTSAEPPKRAAMAAAGADGAPKKPASLIAKRVRLLAGMGDVIGVSELLAAIPGNVTDPELLKVEADARFLANDNARACGIAMQQILAQDGPYWQKSMIFCQILAGDPAKAELGLSMMSELGTRAPEFMLLADRLLGGQKGEVASITNADGLLLAMVRAAEAPLPVDAVQSDRPGVLRAIAVNPNVSADIRLEAAERAEAAGALDTESMRQLYSSVQFEPGDLSKPLSRAQEIGGPPARALLYHAALSQTVPTAQAEIIGQALSAAVAEGRYGASARVFHPLVRKIEPSQAMLWFAPGAVRLMLSNQDLEGARPWLQLLQASALFHKESAAELVRLTPLARLVGSIGLENEPRDLDAWWQAIKGDAGAAAKAARLYALLSGLGDDVSLSAWRALEPAETPAPAGTGATPGDPALLFRLAAVTDAVTAWIEERRASLENAETKSLEGSAPVADASGGAVPGTVSAAAIDQPALPQPGAAAGPPPNRGEILLMALAALGNGGPGSASAFTLRQTVASLRVIGEEKAARGLALEAALAAGL